MNNSEFAENLLGVYHGEQLGEVLFSTMLQSAENDEQHFILASLMQLETEGKAVMRPVLARLNMSLADNSDAIAEGATVARSMTSMSWTDKFAAMASAVRDVYLPKYEELQGLMSADEDAAAHKLAVFMGEHERVVLAVFENVAAGKSEPTAPLSTFLHFPLAAAR